MQNFLRGLLCIGMGYRFLSAYPDIDLFNRASEVTQIP